jgi:hypothetical protein
LAGTQENGIWSLVSGASQIMQFILPFHLHFLSTTPVCNLPW